MGFIITALIAAANVYFATKNFNAAVATFTFLVALVLGVRAELQMVKKN
jgi:hypothetical protein